ncbi:MAG TPA: hypothetical protein ENI08_00950 [Candidatus Dependentiae bacterium]|nr:hypothetical protein [Candidatus Dependentiae bacterium]
MQNIQKIIYFTLFINMSLANSLSAYTHAIINKYDKDVEVTANTILGPDKSVTLTSSLNSPTHIQLDTQDLCVRGFKVRAFNIKSKKWHRLGYAKTKSVVTDILGDPAIARGCMDYQLTIEKDGTLSLERMCEPEPIKTIP